MEIGVKIKEARTRTGLTQEQAAEALGVSRKTISNWENEKTYPDIVSVVKMSDLYAVSLDRLLKDGEGGSEYLDYLGDSTDTVRSRTDRVVMGKYDTTEQQGMQIVGRVHELTEKYGVKMQQIALAWHWARGVASPIVGATKAAYLDDAAGALDIELTAEDIAYIEEPYLPHRIVGAIDKNPPQGVMLLDEKK